MRLPSILVIMVIHLGTAANGINCFTYQGQLVDAGHAATGNYALTFALFDQAAQGSVVGQVITNDFVSITNGLFSVTLAFGEGAFNGMDRWLEIGVRRHGDGGAFTQLAPRQLLTAVPYSLYSVKSGSVVPGAISGVELAKESVGEAHVKDGAITSQKIASGQVVKSINGLKDAVFLVPGGNIKLTSEANAIRISSAPGNNWSLEGNTGVSSSQFLGTTDNRAIEVRVNGARALRIEPNPVSPNMLGGYSGNGINESVTGSTISGGGKPGLHHNIEADYGVIGGGLGNLIACPNATISGGANNQLGNRANDSVISGGAGNNICAGALDSVIGSGWENIIGSNSFSGIISGGSFNRIEAEAPAGTIAGGRANTISVAAFRSTVGGGVCNTNASSQATIGGGAGNSIQASADNSTISGGVGNVIQTKAIDSTIGGGWHNQIGTNANDGSTIGGGAFCVIGEDADASTIAGGRDNSIAAYATSATISGGIANVNGSPQATIGGGGNNLVTANARNATIGGGAFNTADG